MNFISEILFGTPTDSDRKHPRQDGYPGEPRVQYDDDDDDDPAPEEEERATVPPRRSTLRSSAVRARSLSRVYTQVPRGRPTARQAQMDMMEYYAHLAMMETDAERVKLEDQHLRQAIQGCKPRPYGRLYSRLQIASLCISIGALTAPETENDDTEAEPTFTSALLWKKMHQQLKLVKDRMLRKDANIFVPTYRNGYDDTDIAMENDATDTELEKHEMFQDDFREVLVLIRVQEIMAEFCEQLASNTSKAVERYAKSLKKVFEPLGSVPEDLTNVLAKASPDELLKESLAIMSNEESVYSYAQLKIKMRGVLTKWSESILEIPKLVQLGYGGVMSILNAEEDDVSSYGVDEDQLLTQKPVEEEAPRASSNRDRRTSFAEIPVQHLPSKSPRSQNRPTVQLPHDENSKNKNLPSKAPRSQERARTNNEPTQDDDSNTQDPFETPEKRRRSEAEASRSHEGVAASKRQRTSDEKDDLWDDLPDVREIPKPRTKLDWTEDETNAVREGYAMFGKKWAMIKHNSQHRLSRRTNVQIKDKFRTMVKRGEIKELPEMADV